MSRGDEEEAGIEDEASKDLPDEEEDGDDDTAEDTADDAGGDKADDKADDKDDDGYEGDEGPIRYRMPDQMKREMFAIADQLLGASKMIVMCEDGKSRMARIPGKMKRRMWIKPGDLLIIKPWDFQDDKADVRYRYIRTQSSNMSRRGLIPKLLDVGF